MLLKDLQEKRNKIMADASALVAGTEVTAEQRSQFDAMLVDVSVVDGDIARLKAVEEHRAAMKQPVNQPRPTPGESNDPEERAEVRDARTRASFRNYLATGRVESRDLTVAGQGVAIPYLFDSQVIEAQRSYGDIYSMVNVMRTDTGAPLRYVLDNDTTNGLVSLSVGTAAAEVDPTITGATLNVDNFSTGVIKVDNGLLTDSGFNVEDFIRDKFGKRFFRGASNLIINGDGNSVASLLTHYGAQGFTSASVGKLGYADFVNALATLDPAYQPDAVFAMSNATLGSVLSITDSANRPIFLGGYGDASKGFVGTILGRPVKLVTQLASVATGNVPVLFGDFKQAYTWRQVNPGIGILRLNELFAAGYETGFVGFARCGGANTDAGVPAVIGITVK